NGIPPASAEGFQQTVDNLDLVIWVRPTNQASLQVHSEGGGANTELIKAKTINKADLLIGGPADGIGKVGFFEPVMPGKEILDMLTPAARETVVDRFLQRQEEYGHYKDPIAKHVAEGLVRVKDKVLQI